MSDALMGEGMYQTCPFCDRVFEIGESDYRPMKHHIRAFHIDSDSDEDVVDRSSPTPPAAPL